MIEKVYSGKEPGNGTAVKIPKNIKQIGHSISSKKIYVEELVVSKLKQLPERENDIRYGVLFGEIQNSGGNSYIFVKGLAEVRDVIENSIIFNDEIWSGIYQDKKQFFEKLEIVGWYVSVPYRVSEDMNGIRKLHLDNFAGNNKVCFLADRAENEEGFYIYEHSSFQRQKGYYIYYGKNDKMKKYVKYLENNQSQLASLSKKEKPEIKNMAGKIEKKENLKLAQPIKIAGEESKKQGRLAYGINGILIIALLLSTVVMLNNYGELKNIKQELANYSLMKEAKAVNEIIDAYNGGETQEQTPTAQTNSQKEAETQMRQIEENEDMEEIKEKTEIKKDKITKEKGTNVANASVGTYHTVEKGQTLYDISIKYYGTSKMIDKIKKANKIDDDYKIIEGEKILLP